MIIILSTIVAILILALLFATFITLVCLPQSISNSVDYRMVMDDGHIAPSIGTPTRNIK